MINGGISTLVHTTPTTKNTLKENVTKLLMTTQDGHFTCKPNSLMMMRKNSMTSTPLMTVLWSLPTHSAEQCGESFQTSVKKTQTSWKERRTLPMERNSADGLTHLAGVTKGTMTIWLCENIQLKSSSIFKVCIHKIFC